MASVMSVVPPSPAPRSTEHSSSNDGVGSPCLYEFWTHIPVIAEVEARDTCRWLKAAGFPQYVQMFADRQFPIDIHCAVKDHDFLDADSVQALLRRLNTLNWCSSMKIEGSLKKLTDDSDEEDAFALSDKWSYQRSSRRWSRVEDMIAPHSSHAPTASHRSASVSAGTPCSDSTSSHPSPRHFSVSAATNLAITKNKVKDSPKRTPERQPEVPSPSRSLPRTAEDAKSRQSPVVSRGTSRDEETRSRLDSDTSGGSPGPGQSPSSPFKRSASDRLREARTFFHRIGGSLRDKKGGDGCRSVDISSPVLIDSPGLQRKMAQLGCYDLYPQVKDVGSDSQLAGRQRCASPVWSSSRNAARSMSPLTSPFVESESTSKSVTNTRLSLHNGVGSTAHEVSPAVPGAKRRGSEDIMSPAENGSLPPIPLDHRLSTYDNMVPDAGPENDLDFIVGGKQLPATAGLRPADGNLQRSTPHLATSLKSGCSALHQLATAVSKSCSSPSVDLLNDVTTSPTVTDGILVTPATRSRAATSAATTRGLLTTRGKSAACVTFVADDDKSHCGYGKGKFIKPCSLVSYTDINSSQQLSSGSVDSTGTSPHASRKYVSLPPTSSGSRTSSPLPYPTSPSLSLSGKDTPPRRAAAGSSLARATDPRKELDMVLQDLLNNIGDLSLQLTVSTSKLSSSSSSSGGGGSDAGKTNSLLSPPPTVTTTNTTTSRSSSSKNVKALAILMADGQEYEVSSSDPQVSPRPSPAKIMVDQADQQDRTDEMMADDEGAGYEACPSELLTAELLFSEEDDSLSPLCPRHEPLSADGDNVSTCSSPDSDMGTESRDEESSGSLGDGHERRDSGVGSSLTRTARERRQNRIRWHSFVKSHRPNVNNGVQHVSSMSVGQLTVIRKLCLLKVTAVLEKYSLSTRFGWAWMPKLIRRLKAPDYRDKNVFGVPLSVIQQRSGQPLPQCVLFAMRCLRRNAKTALGIFRKSGVKSRIMKLRNDLETNASGVDFETLQPYDVADLLKQYFRELPDCLLTSKLSGTFLAIFTYVCPEERLDALQAAILLLPDENREVLQCLLSFLADMALSAAENQMTASNLAVCFAPSLFHLTGTHGDSASSPRWVSKQNASVPSVPCTQRDLQDQRAAHECLTDMIIHCHTLFIVPEEMMNKCRLSYLDLGEPVPIEELGPRRFQDESCHHAAYVDSCVEGLLKEARDKFKGWVGVATLHEGVDLAYKKVNDEHPLRLWKCTTEIAASPSDLLNRLLQERHLWDEDLVKWRVVEKLDSQTEVFHYVLNSMAPHPQREFCELRSWRSDRPRPGCYVVVATSVQYPGVAPPAAGIRGVTLASRYLIEPCSASGKSRLTHIVRTDVRGHSQDWYSKVFGHTAARYTCKIRDSFRNVQSFSAVCTESSL